ncbi:M3 family oligoendopeptidase [Bacillus sp. AGMB 02131]|uniref:M3 family oligoendopeptidase n=1 Tax=Peribacillus faecalis TaxID=2772559 RepID=A0A927HC15_9BACI|nr:M3 family oligoendopeptidase [Peribacillus faecalis]MBD3109539.1 M3 family oligoendopeptidase [Peribacillus faecalis]
MTYSQVWDLDVFFEGGSDSASFAAYIKETENKIIELGQLISSWGVTSTQNDREQLASILALYAEARTKITQSSAFISCLEAQNVKDQGAKKWRAEITKLVASVQGAMSALDEKLVSIEAAFFEQLVKEEPFTELQFILQESRRRAQEKLSVEAETLIQQLGIDGYHGWGQLYDSLVATIEIPYEEDGKVQMLSAGQAANKMLHPDREVRKRLFQAWEKAWGEKEELFAHALNHLAGFRLKVYEKRGWGSVLKEPLDTCRMSEETLNSMWQAITDSKDHLVRFLDRKAKLLGVEKLSWYDVDAPLLTAPQKQLSYDEGAEFILKQFALFGEQLTAFAKKAFEDRWIEAEDRPNKRPGGFCTGFPDSQQSRIFMTYSGTLNNVSTLAHELGHAFHSYALRDVHPLNRGYAMNVAETASTFAEMIVSDAAVKEASTKEEKIAMLEDKIQRTIAFFMNIHARFLFETRFYEERKHGMVPASRLNELMQEAQKEAFLGALDEYHPQFWSSKLHFYITSVPFYNFPYTFGYLFSLGIYEKALESGEGFEEKYMALLRDTGCMTVEELAMKHLQEDLTGPEFWERAVQSCVKDIKSFLELTE